MKSNTTPRHERDFSSAREPSQPSGAGRAQRQTFPKHPIGDKAGSARGKKSEFNPGLAAEKALWNTAYLFVPNDCFYSYRDGCWKRENEHYILQVIDKILGERAKRHQRIETLEKLRVHPKVLLPHGIELDQHAGFINLPNGMLDLSTSKLQPHAPRFFSTVRVPTPFKLDATCPKWASFLDQVLPDENQQAALGEFFGCCLTADCKFEKAAIFYGASGCNGKSVTISILESLLGLENCAHEPWASLTERFHLIRLKGKLLNVSAETPPDKITDTSLFKQLVSGDVVSDSRKYQDRIDFRPFAKLCFACNSLPRIGDSSEAFFRRILIFDFPNSFRDREDRDLAGRLKGEISGILNWALAGLRRLRKNNGFTQSEKMGHQIEQFRRMNSPIRTFVKERCEEGPKFSIGKARLFSEYKDFCGDNALPATNAAHFFRELKNIVPFQEKRTGSMAAREQVIVGLQTRGG